MLTIRCRDAGRVGRSGGDLLSSWSLGFVYHCVDFSGVEMMRVFILGNGSALEASAELPLLQW